MFDGPKKSLAAPQPAALLALPVVLVRHGHSISAACCKPRFDVSAMPWAILLFVNEVQASAKFETDPGLCADCQHCRRVESSRGSAFVFCELAFRDPTFPKYPRLPILTCRGYEKKDEGA